MAESKNALAELAKEIRVMNLWVDIKYENILDKAQRIVEELAKVEDRREGETNSDVLWRCNYCIAMCRVIAEEGVKMASEYETVEDIAKMMRRNEEVFHHLYWCEYADRIEAAYRREVAELRECLEQAYGDKIGTYTMKGNEVERWHKALSEEGGAK